MVEVIYTLTVCREKDFIKDGQPWRATRCWGWYPTFEDAELALTQNTDFWAECGYYDHAVIERYEAGFSIGERLKWYVLKYDDARQSYDITSMDDPPAPWSSVCNFALG